MCLTRLPASGKSPPFACVTSQRATWDHDLFVVSLQKKGKIHKRIHFFGGNRSVLWGGSKHGAKYLCRLVPHARLLKKLRIRPLFNLWYPALHPLHAQCVSSRWSAQNDDQEVFWMRPCLFPPQHQWSFFPLQRNSAERRPATRSLFVLWKETLLRASAEWWGGGRGRGPHPKLQSPD